MVEIQKYVPAASALLFLQCDLESYLTFLLLYFALCVCAFRFLMDHPEYVRDGVTLSQFSFQIPKPLQENYVRKRPTKLKSSCEDNGPIEPDQGIYYK